MAALLNETEALKGMMLACQHRTDTLEQQTTALESRLHEEVQARQALGQQVATPVAQKRTPRRKPQAV